MACYFSYAELSHAKCHVIMSNNAKCWYSKGLFLPLIVPCGILHLERRCSKTSDADAIHHHHHHRMLICIKHLIVKCWWWSSTWIKPVPGIFNPKGIYIHIFFNAITVGFEIILIWRTKFWSGPHRQRCISLLVKFLVQVGHVCFIGSELLI